MSPVLPHESPEMHVDLGDRVFAAKVPALEARPGESVESFRSRISDTAWTIQVAVMKIIQAANAGNAAAPETRTRATVNYYAGEDRTGVTVNYHAAAAQTDTAPSASIRKILDGVEDAHAADPDRHLFDVIQTTTRRVAAADNRRRKRAEVQYGTVTEWAKSGHLRVVPEEPTEAPADMGYLRGYLPVIGDRVTYVADVILGKAPTTENEHRA